MRDCGLTLAADQRSRHAGRLPRAGLAWARQGGRRRRARGSFRRSRSTASPTRSSGRWASSSRKASCTCWASASTPTTRSSRARWSSSAAGAERRIVLMIERLRELDYPIDEQIAPALASEEAIGRPHVARALVAAGYAESVQDAFDRFIDRKGPAYVPRQGLSTRQAIDAIRAAGGIAGAGALPGGARAARPHRPARRLGHRRPRGLLPPLRARDRREDGRARGGARSRCHWGQ